jgi:hypothetical protein
MQDKLDLEERQKREEELLKDQQVFPPDAGKRTFNENDILGEFDRDEKGNVIVLEDPATQLWVDKRGRRVNERGYLMNADTGDIIENKESKKMFEKKDMDERGEVPAPFCLEKYNFNPFGVRGDFDFDRSGYPILSKGPNGTLLDKKGRKVNPKGWLVDAEGNLCDQQGRKKFDRK